MTMLVIFYTLHLGKYRNQMLVSYGSIILTLGNQLIESLSA